MFCLKWVFRLKIKQDNSYDKSWSANVWLHHTPSLIRLPKQSNTSKQTLNLVNFKHLVWDHLLIWFGLVSAVPYWMHEGLWLSSGVASLMPAIGTLIPPPLWEGSLARRKKQRCPKHFVAFANGTMTWIDLPWLYGYLWLIDMNMATLFIKYLNQCPM